MLRQLAANVDDGDDRAALMDRANALDSKARKLCQRRTISNVLDRGQSQTNLATTGNRWDSNPMLLGVASGVIDLETGKLRPGRPTDFVRTVAPTEFVGLGEKAPRWERFLLEIFSDDAELVSFVQRLLGYGLTGQQTEHSLPVFFGAGRNGKDTLLAAVQQTLGTWAGSVSSDILLQTGRNPGGASPHLYALRQKRLAFVNETNEGARLNAGQVKLITGGGRIPCRPLYGKPTSFLPQFLLVLLTNNKPHASADDYALWKRLLLVPFTRSFVDSPQADHERQRDPLLPALLKSETSGILSWLVRGCLDWQDQGLNPPKSVIEATKEYRDGEDTLGHWLSECCMSEAEVNAQPTEPETQAAVLYNSYKMWSDESGIKPMSMTAFGKRLKKRFRFSKGQRIVYHGVALAL